VFVHASAEGWRGTQLLRDEFVNAYYPRAIAGKTRRAISWTTAASVCAVVEMVNSGILPARGFIKQEEIVFADFLRTENGSLFAGDRSFL
ncbi:MAG TPA: hypothetical protein VK857_01975, partial [Desulforhopalus sp.]|nr:hypothetical protein [Desulforhopalus sp.]